MRAPERDALEVRTRSAEVTRAFGAALAAVALPGDRLALLGPLGSGKTQFAKGFARGLGIDEVVNSPSFTLMAEYAGRLTLFHQDLFRLAGPSDVLDGGLLDERADAGVTLSEWANRLGTDLDPDRLEVRFAVMDDEARRITLAASPDGRYERYLRVARDWSAGQA